MKRSMLSAMLLHLFVCAFILLGCQASDASKDMKPLTEKYMEVWNTGNLQGLDAIMDPNFHYHDNLSPDVSGLDGLKGIITAFRTAFPDVRLVSDDELYSGDKCAVRWSWTGTNTGAGEMPPTGKSVRMSGISILHFANGKITDEWLAYDNQALMRQLGVAMPQSPGGTK